MPPPPAPLRRIEVLGAFAPRFEDRLITRDTLRGLIDAECAALTGERPDARVAEARKILEDTVLNRELPEFFTTEAYRRHLVRRTESPS
ncbi:hypothetical protein [Streptomyces erythrochromogenes]|uniref:hypothetical protein n=1 Tax=Streptomyces erythrochromogenes TaxID=285574 RepID=UPI0037D28C76